MANIVFSRFLRSWTPNNFIGKSAQQLSKKVFSSFSLSNNFFSPFGSNTLRQEKSFSSQSQQNGFILSIDGGGIRGIIPGRILQEIEKQTEQPIAHSFDIIAGTSTGGILGLGISLPKEDDLKEPRYTAAEVVQFYTEPKFKDAIFNYAKSTESRLIKVSGSSNTSWPMLQKNLPIAGIDIEWGKISAHLVGQKVIEIKIAGKYYKIVTKTLKVLIPQDDIRNLNSYQFHSDYKTIRRLIMPKFSKDGIEMVLKDRFGNTSLSELIPKEVFVTAFNTSKMKHCLWSKSAAECNSHLNIRAWEAARATSAAPTFFPAFNINGNEFIDGGVCMNNPTLAALAQAKTLKISKKEIFCVSLGTGQFDRPLAPTSHFGPLHWSLNIFDVAHSGMSSQTDEYAQAFLRKNQYVRIQIDLPTKISLDSTDDDTIATLERLAQKAIKENSQKLEEIYQAIITRKEKELKICH